MACNAGFAMHQQLVAEVAALRSERDEQRMAIGALQARLIAAQASHAGLQQRLIDLERLLCQSLMGHHPEAAAASRQPTMEPAAAQQLAFGAIDRMAPSPAVAACALAASCGLMPGLAAAAAGLQQSTSGAIAQGPIRSMLDAVGRAATVRCDSTTGQSPMPLLQGPVEVTSSGSVLVSPPMSRPSLLSEAAPAAGWLRGKVETAQRTVTPPPMQQQVAPDVQISLQTTEVTAVPASRTLSEAKRASLAAAELPQLQEPQEALPPQEPSQQQHEEPPPPPPPPSLEQQHEQQPQHLQPEPSQEAVEVTAEAIIVSQSLSEISSTGGATSSSSAAPAAAKPANMLELLCSVAHSHDADVGYTTPPQDDASSTTSSKDGREAAGSALAAEAYAMAEPSAVANDLLSKALAGSLGAAGSLARIRQQSATMGQGPVSQPPAVPAKRQRYGY